MKASIRSTIQTVDQQLADPALSPIRREELRRTKEALQSTQVDIQLRKIATLSEALALGDAQFLLNSQEVTAVPSLKPAAAAGLLGLVPSDTPVVQVADEPTS
jgi:hypothetical protein